MSSKSSGSANKSENSPLKRSFKLIVDGYNLKFLPYLCEPNFTIFSHHAFFIPGYLAKINISDGYPGGFRKKPVVVPGKIVFIFDGPPERVSNAFRQLFLVIVQHQQLYLF